MLELVKQKNVVAVQCGLFEEIMINKISNNVNANAADLKNVDE